MRGSGVALKGVSLLFRTLEFGCAAVILALFSYFLANLHDHNRAIPTRERAIEGISGSAVLYTILAFLFVCCLGSITFFSFLAMLLDVAFTGAFIYIAWATRSGVKSYTNVVCTPLGCGDWNSNVTGSNIRYITAHRMETAVFAVAIMGLILFFLNIFVEFGLARHHKKEKAFGPSPNNGYTAGSPKRKFWQRNRRPDTEMVGGFGGAKKVHPDALPPHTSPADVRTSYATDATAVEPATKYEHTNPVVGHQPGQATTTDHHVPYAQQHGYAPGSAQMPAGNYHATANSNGTF